MQSFNPVLLITTKAQPAQKLWQQWLPLSRWTGQMCWNVENRYSHLPRSSPQASRCRHVPTPISTSHWTQSKKDRNNRFVQYKRHLLVYNTHMAVRIIKLHSLPCLLSFSIVADHASAPLQLYVQLTSSTLDNNYNDENVCQLLADITERFWRNQKLNLIFKEAVITTSTAAVL